MSARESNSLRTAARLENLRKAILFRTRRPAFWRLRLLYIQLRYQFLSFYFGQVPRWRLWLRALGDQDRVLPDFVVTGAIKCATTDFAANLVMHPNIHHPLCKEIHTVHPPRLKLYYPTKKKLKALSAVCGPMRCGYFGPFLQSLRVATNLHAISPNLKVVVLLRDPAFRAYSHWKWEVLWAGPQGRRLEHFQEFNTYIRMALDFFPEYPMDTACGVPLLQSGIYYRAVEVWIELFGADNVLVLDVGQYICDRQPVLASVHDFLKLDPISIPVDDEIINENPLRLSGIDSDSLELFRGFYRPYNEKLYRLLSKDFHWDDQQRAASR